MAVLEDKFLDVLGSTGKRFLRFLRQDELCLVILCWSMLVSDALANPAARITRGALLRDAELCLNVSYSPSVQVLVSDVNIGGLFVALATLLSDEKTSLSVLTLRA